MKLSREQIDLVLDVVKGMGMCPFLFYCGDRTALVFRALGGDELSASEVMELEELMGFRMEEKQD